MVTQEFKPWLVCSRAYCHRCPPTRPLQLQAQRGSGGLPRDESKGPTVSWGPIDAALGGMMPPRGNDKTQISCRPRKATRAGHLIPCVSDTSRVCALSSFTQLTLASPLTRDPLYLCRQPPAVANCPLSTPNSLLPRFLCRPPRPPSSMLVALTSFTAFFPLFRSPPPRSGWIYANST